MTDQNTRATNDWRPSLDKRSSGSGIMSLSASLSVIKEVEETERRVSELSENLLKTSLTEEETETETDDDDREQSCHKVGTAPRSSIDDKSCIIHMLPRELSLMGFSGSNSISNAVEQLACAGDFSDEPTYHVEQTKAMDERKHRGSYSGSLSSRTHLPHGWGHMKYHVGGQEYSGEWCMGRWHGYGEIVATNGDRYEGSVVQFQKQGPGRLKFANGAILFGKFDNDEAIEGMIRNPDGTLESI